METLKPVDRPALQIVVNELVELSITIVGRPSRSQALSSASLWNVADAKCWSTATREAGERARLLHR